MVRTDPAKRKKDQSTDSSLFSPDNLVGQKKVITKTLKKRSKRNTQKSGEVRTVAASIRSHFAVARKSTGAAMDATVTNTDAVSDLGTIADHANGGARTKVNTTVSASDLMEKLVFACGQLTKLTQTVEEMRGEIFGLRQENDALKQELVCVKRNEEKLKDDLSEAKQSATVARKRVNDLEQYTRRNNVRVFGVREADNETTTDCERKVLQMFRDKLGLTIKEDQIEACHRVGAAKGKPQRRATEQQQHHGKPRPIIVRFVSRKTTEAVLHIKRKLKTTAYMVVEDLTRDNYYLLQKCRDHPAVISAWSKRGNIYIKTENNRIVQISSTDDLLTVSGTAPVTSTPHSSDLRPRGFGRGRGRNRSQRSDGERRPGRNTDEVESDSDIGATGGSYM
ncbi:hypothetical protein BaRGS_00037464 [Batillaria attramentaria]|uniref:Uncharacterized protein n=1 Tax=Batillaria attramentaria TaxID=370345 RepID=A0ABD0J8N6_9CAEN